MFCPQCGQQSSDEIRFCPRCGLSLVPHAELVAAVNTTTDDTGAAQAPVRSARRAGSRRGAKLMFFGVVLFPLFLLLSIAADTPGPLFPPLILFFAGLSWWGYSRLFGEDQPHVTQQTSREGLKAGKESPALGAAQFTPAPSFGRPRADTAEIAPPPSVTEHTTKLLDPDS
jgi:hypothetical protein